MSVQLRKRIVAVILAGDISTSSTELLQLLLEVLGRRLDERLDPLQVFGVVHFCSRISDNLDILREKVVSVLWCYQLSRFGYKSDIPRSNL